MSSSPQPPGPPVVDLRSPDHQGLGATISGATGCAELLVGSLPYPAVVLDLAGHLLFANPAAVSAYGLVVESAGKSWESLVETTFGSATQRAEALSTLMRDGSWAGRARQLWADGTWHDIDATATVVPVVPPSADPESMSKGWLGSQESVVIAFAHDVTPVRQAEADAARQAEFARLVVDSLPGRTCVIDSAGDVVSVNARYAHEGPLGTGKATGPTVGRSYVRWLRTEVSDEVADHLCDLLTNHRSEFSAEIDSSARGLHTWTAIEATPLRHAGGGAVIHHEDITERKRVESALTKQATHDPLTSLPNRALLAERLSHCQEEAARTNAAVAVLFCDLDGFREVNNTYGHVAGDELLVILARRLRSVCRATDTVARISGDEFAIVMRHVHSREQVQDVAGRVIAALSEPAHLGDHTVVAGVSIGLVLADCTPAGPTDVTRVLADADLAMYAAKSAGRGRWVWFTEDLRQRPATKS